MIECDVVIAGAGLAGGLPAAAYLQKAGLDVVLIERGVDTGKFYQSYELLPGVYFDHSPVNFSCLSPAMLDLDLEAAGYVVKLPSILHSVIDGNGNNATFYPETGKTLQQLQQFSDKDAARFGRILERLQPNWTRFLKLLFFSPHPDREKYEEAIALSAEALEMPVPELMATDGIELLERLFESEQSRIFLIPLPALNLFGDLTVPGQGALSWLWALLLRACIAPAGNQSLVRALERVYLRHGGTLLRDTVVEKFLIEGGHCKGIRTTGGDSGRVKRIVARKAVISNLGASLTYKLLDGAELPADFEQQLTGWSMAKRVLAIHDFVLNREPEWKANEANPDFGLSPRIYLVWNTWNECINWLRKANTEEASFHGDVELTLTNNIYDQSDSGKFALRVRHGTGPYSMALEQRREVFAERMIGSLDSISGDIARRIVAHQMATPLDFWRANPAALHGNPVGGDFIEGQWILDRCPYRTPVNGLFMSNSVWPTALSWLAPGYNAAGVVMEELGLDLPSWWSHEPGEWFLNRIRSKREEGLAG